MTLVMVLASAVNATGGNIENGFAYNCEEKNGQVTTEYVYRVDGQYLRQHLKYDFTYDAEGRVIRKEAQRWNDASDGYVPYYCLEMSYSDIVTEVEYALWDKAAGCYSAMRSKVVYMACGGYMDYRAYEWDGNECCWNLTLSHTSGGEMQLLAVGE